MLGYKQGGNPLPGQLGYGYGLGKVTEDNPS